MNRLFGSGKPKEPPPNLQDCINNVSRLSSNVIFEQSKSLFDAILTLQRLTDHKRHGISSFGLSYGLKFCFTSNYNKLKLQSTFTVY